ncbi:MAG: aminotransferase class I/II-fold pyridoxal phosphate-dependent enzyme [Clostridia bacterium]|nr:aminotransferase class I/II-fold pyridoxal phosphate-dependent enzyme [Clostridia bacterium]
MGIYESLKQFREISFHMPGHKGNIPVPVVDVTELNGTDNLMCPDGIILQSQQHMAKVLGKKEAFFLTNGASSGILASILASVSDGDTVLVDRNCHVSVMNGLILSGAVPKFIYPKENKQFGIPSPLSAGEVTYSGEKAVILTSPTYYGEVSDVESIRAKVGDAILIQDESHGAHFYFSPHLKHCRTDAADLSVLSFHKTMPTLNQGAVLTLNSEKISSERVKQAINMVTTTSPSYPILSSLDYSGMYGAELYEKDTIITKIKTLKQALLRETNLRILENDDCYKLFVNCDGVNLSAKEIQTILEEKHAIYIEGVFGNNLLFMFSPCNRTEEVELLQQALLSVDLLPENKKTPAVPVLKLTQQMSPREAYFSEGEVIPAKKAVGRVSKENITQFPPCVPLVTIGEKLTEEAVSYLDRDFIEVVK